MDQLTYWRSETKITGNSMTCFLQKTFATVNAIEAYIPPINAILSTNSKFLTISQKDFSFLDQNFPTHVNRDFILDNSKQFLNKLSMLTDLYIGTSILPKYLPIDNYDLQILGSYEDENGVLHLGPDYSNIETIFQTLLVHYLVQFGDSAESNEISLELTSLKKKRENSPLTLQNLDFKSDQTRKQWLQKWIDVFRVYQFTDSNSPLINKMNEIIIDREKNFMGMSSGFDLDRDNEKFDKRELLLAGRVISVLTDLFGNYMFKEMFSGGVMVKDGTVQFISHPWDNVYKFINNINIGYILGSSSPTHVRQKYILDKFTSRFDIELPTDGTIDISEAIISVDEIPVKFLLPNYKKPTDKSFLSEFYTVISYQIYDHFETLDHFKRLNLERSWRSQFYKKLMQICRDRGFDSLQLSQADEGFRSSIFGYITTDFQLDAFNWLTSRGKSWITLTHTKGELKLSPADFRHYFKDDWGEFAMSLHVPHIGGDKKINSRIESDLRYMQDFIIDTISFIFELAENAVNKKIILYPHTTAKSGFIVNPKNSYTPPKDEDLFEWYLHAGSPKQYGITLDLNDLDSVNKFVEMIPILLGNLLVRPAAFIVRDPDYPFLTNDQCMFAFGMSGSLLPSQMVGGSIFGGGPPSTGMRWTNDDNEANYKRSTFYLRWNEILSRHNTLKVHKYSDANKFYEIVRSILFTSIDDIGFYF